MPALAESWLPAPAQPSCTLYDCSTGLCLWKAVFSSSPALFPLIVILARAGCWFKLPWRCNGGFFWPSLQLETEQAKPSCEPRAVLCSGMSRDVPAGGTSPFSKNPCPTINPSLCSSCTLLSDRGKKQGKSAGNLNISVTPCVECCCHVWRLSSS